MPGIVIIQGIAKRSVSIRLSANQLSGRDKKAVLLNASGARLKTFPLAQELNELSLGNIAPGTYSIRVETGDEVMVQQIMLP